MCDDTMPRNASGEPNGGFAARPSRQRSTLNRPSEGPLLGRKAAPVRMSAFRPRPRAAEVDPRRIAEIVH